MFSQLSSSTSSIIQSKLIKAEKTLYQLKNKIDNFQDQSKKLKDKNEVFTAKVKQLIIQNKKKQAKRIVGDLVFIRKRIQSINIRMKVLKTQKAVVQEFLNDFDITGIIQKAISYYKDNSYQDDEINIIHSQQFKKIRQETEKLISELEFQDLDQQQKIDKLFEELLAEVNSHKVAINLHNQNQNLLKVKPIAPKILQDDLEEWLN